MRLYFKRAELLLEKREEKYVLEMGGQVLGTFTQEKRAVGEYNRIRQELEAKLPPSKLSEEDNKEMLEKYLADNLVNYFPSRPTKKKPTRSRTFG